MRYKKGLTVLLTAVLLLALNFPAFAETITEKTNLRVTIVSLVNDKAVSDSSVSVYRKNKDDPEPELIQTGKTNKNGEFVIEVLKGDYIIEEEDFSFENEKYSSETITLTVFNDVTVYLKHKAADHNTITGGSPSGGSPSGGSSTRTRNTGSSGSTGSSRNTGGNATITASKLPFTGSNIKTAVICFSLIGASVLVIILLAKSKKKEQVNENEKT